MKIFLKRTFYFLMPLLLILAISISADFFKVFGFHDYYDKNNIVGLNREMICTKTYNHYRRKVKYNSFIFGSSRSQAYKCKNWGKYLNNKAISFHFDAYGEGIWGISKKIEYIDKLGDNIDNALIVVDRTVLRNTKNREGHLFISMPCISNESEYEYYLTFLKASINPKFLFAYIDFSIFKTYRGYMGDYVGPSEETGDSMNCDVYYEYDNQIAIDSLGYYNRLIEKGIFYNRPQESDWKCEVSDKEIEQLKAIRNIFLRHNTRYKIIISPIYDQIPLEQEQIDLLRNIFGKENIYNFSGKNKFTDPIYNYYETSHYRPHVANEIMKIIYK